MSAATATASATATYPAAPTARPTQTPIPARRPTGPPVGPLAVYSSELFLTSSGGRHWPTREVRAFDTGTGKEWASFSYGAPEDYAVGEDLAAGHLVVYATNTGVRLRALEGGPTRLLYGTPEGVSVTRIAVSHSGKWVAVATFFKDSAGNALSDLLVIDMASGTAGPAPAEVVRNFHSTDPQLATGFYGYFEGPQWLVDDVGVMVVGANQKDGPGARATLFLDGTIQVNQPAWRRTSPDGRYAFVSSGSPCFGGDFSKIRIVDAVADRTVAMVAPISDGVFAESGCLTHPPCSMYGGPIPSTAALIART